MGYKTTGREKETMVAVGLIITERPYEATRVKVVIWVLGNVKTVFKYFTQPDTCQAGLQGKQYFNLFGRVYTL